MKTRSEIRRHIFQHKIIAVIRLRSAPYLEENMEPIVQAIIAGGIRIIEITLDTPGALDWIRHFSESFKKNTDAVGGECIIGAGTVLDMAGAGRALEMGAQFLVSPVLFEEMVTFAHESDACAMPSGFTPTELWRAWNAGADLVKIFPASGAGPDTIKAIRGPLPQIPLCPSSGVTPENAEAYLRAGAAALGAGTSLVNQQFVQERAGADTFAEITRRAALFTTLANAAGQTFSP